MGTRADFYVGRGDDMKWVGSIAWDGYPSGIDKYRVLVSSTEQEFLDGVSRLAEARDDFTPPEMGWPWPWGDSGTTDFAYAFDGDRVYVSRFGDDWVTAHALLSKTDKDEELTSCGSAVFPDMTEIQNVDFGSRSGVMFLRS
ncbi:hypothetical protein G6L37_00915 [Agrobacterium rubi]|nr:hypothetical protein [Agrobacterium rubi]NTF23952.1 hypothetical protein [Agrobacterium rubi]